MTLSRLNKRTYDATAIVILVVFFFDFCKFQKLKIIFQNSFGFLNTLDKSLE
jgi:hypothetical protein